MAVGCSIALPAGRARPWVLGILVIRRAVKVGWPCWASAQCRRHGRSARQSSGGRVGRWFGDGFRARAPRGDNDHRQLPRPLAGTGAELALAPGPANGHRGRPGATFALGLRGADQAAGRHRSRLHIEDDPVDIHLSIPDGASELACDGAIRPAHAAIYSTKRRSSLTRRHQRTPTDFSR